MRATWPWRWLTAGGRTLPDVIIPGVQKGGTSSLFAWMIQHPDVHGSRPKEVHFFDGGRDPAVDRWPGARRWYRAHFPTARRVGSAGIVVEATPRYLFHPDAPSRIAKVLPDVRLVVLLRNPVERAISHYHHSRIRGREPLSLLDALDAEDDRLRVQRDGSWPLEGTAWVHYSYRRRGHYARQLRRLWKHVDRERTLVIDSDRLYGQPRETLRRVFAFCGVRSDVLPDDLAPRMVGRREGEDEEARARLERYFAGPNEELWALLGERFGW